MTDTRGRLRDLITELAVVRGRVTLSSGREADYYIDLRRITLHHEAAPLVGHVLLDRLEEVGLGPGEVDAVGGSGQSRQRRRAQKRDRREARDPQETRKRHGKQSLSGAIADARHTRCDDRGRIEAAFPAGNGRLRRAARSAKDRQGIVRQFRRDRDGRIG